jgi:hypothetical protein
MVPVMTARRITLALATATVLIWTLKALVIWEAGGLDKSDAEGPLFLLGFFACILTWSALGVALTIGRAMWQRALAGVVGLVAGVVVVMLFDSLADVLPDSIGWVHEEAGLWTAAIVTFVTAFGLLRNRKARASVD